MRSRVLPASRGDCLSGLGGKKICQAALTLAMNVAGGSIAPGTGAAGGGGAGGWLLLAYKCPAWHQAEMSRSECAAGISFTFSRLSLI